MPHRKLAVVLMNLGGPDSLEAVRPFLYNLFSDPAIIRLPPPLRQMLAWIISSRRDGKAREIYGRLGGKSPLLENTQEQANSLKKVLQKSFPGWEIEVFIAMRYWHPMTEETYRNMKKFDPDNVVLLPLYPQYSTTTTASSVAEWQRLAGLDDKPPAIVGCYFDDPGFVDANVDLIRKALQKAPKSVKNRLLFSAHGLPQKIVDEGDPYQWQVEQSVQRIMERLDPNMDHAVCYQSRVGPLKWLTPCLDDEMERAKQDGVGVIVVPISFTSEHSETLVELDMDYLTRSQELGISYYDRVPTVATHLDFIKGLSNLVASALDHKAILKVKCPNDLSECFCRQMADPQEQELEAGHSNSPIPYTNSIQSKGTCRVK